MRQTLPRRLWKLFEPYHAVVYFSTEVSDAMQDVGLKGFWMGYFAGRAAPLGPVGPRVVGATFYNFRPEMVARAIPDAWGFASPEAVLEARLAAVDATLRRLLGPAVDSDEMLLAAELARMAAEACDEVGRPLAAAHRQLPWPDAPHLVLWHASSILREHRGDGHVAALLTAGLDGCEALITMSATGAIPRAMLQQARGWTDEEWTAATGRLRERGWLDADMDLTPDGRAGRDEIEHLTDALAASPWRPLGTESASQLAALLQSFTDRILDSGGLPIPNPIGVARD